MIHIIWKKQKQKKNIVELKKKVENVYEDISELMDKEKESFRVLKKNLENFRKNLQKFDD